MLWNLEETKGRAATVRDVVGAELMRCTTLNVHGSVVEEAFQVSVLA